MSKQDSNEPENLKPLTEIDELNAKIEELKKKVVQKEELIEGLRNRLYTITARIHEGISELDVKDSRQ